MLKIYPFGLIWATVVDTKGIQSQALATRLAQYLQYTGLVQMAYRSDQEPSLTALFSEACKLAGKKPLPITAEQEGEAIEAMRQEDLKEPGPDASGTAAHASQSLEPSPAMVDPPPPPPVPETTLIAVPELSHPGESASNGAAERAVRSLVEQARCLKVALEENMGVRIPSSHNVIRWLVEHAAYTLNKFQINREGRTA